ncbi:MAG: glucose-1-phosphate thymidylyltransferase [Deltaproteobacteria bacterium]|nr:glucose-1-phosphate thymidylyltransferase [Deltaproteobacteria bacterium]
MTDFSQPTAYFNLPPEGPLAAPLAEVQAVWEILDRLAGWINDLIRPNVAPLRKTGGLVDKMFALHLGEVLVAERYNLKGENGLLEVFVGGQKLPGAALIMPGAYIADERVEIGPDVMVESGAYLKGPTILGPGTEVRQGAYVRGEVFSLAKAVIGHATEVKNTLLLTGAKAGHFAYLGDSVLGQEVNLGAGTKLANLNMGDKPITVKGPFGPITLSRRKLGAIIGDYTETGCNSVTAPGTLLGPHSRLWPNKTTKASYYPPNSVIKD